MSRVIAREYVERFSRLSREQLVVMMWEMAEQAIKENGAMDAAFVMFNVMSDDDKKAALDGAVCGYLDTMAEKLFQVWF